VAILGGSRRRNQKKRKEGDTISKGGRKKRLPLSRGKAVAEIRDIVESARRTGEKTLPFDRHDVRTEKAVEEGNRRRKYVGKPDKGKDQRRRSHERGRTHEQPTPRQKLATLIGTQASLNWMMREGVPNVERET